MNKKNKTKKSRKLLPVLLCIVLMLSMFTLSAFAEETECDIYGHQGGDSTFNGVAGECVYECGVCDYEVRCYATQDNDIDMSDIECGTEVYFSYVDTYTGGADGDPIVAYCCYNCSCENGHTMDVKWTLTPIVDTPETENKSLIGSMISTITDSLGGILVGVGSSIVAFFNGTVLTAEGELTTFAIWALAFLGIGFGFGVIKFITNIVRKR